MKQLIRRVWSDTYLRNAAIFFSGSMLVAVLNYLRYPLLGRVLSVEAFGEVQALLAVYSEIAIALSAFSLATVHISSNCEDADECATVVGFFRDVSLWLVGGLFLIVVLGSQIFASALHLSSALPFALLGAMLVVSALLSTRTGYLQGRNRFGRAFVTSAVVSGSSLVCVVLFAWLGWGSSGVISGIVAGQLLGFGYAWFHTRHALKRHPDRTFVLTVARKREELLHVGCTVLTMASMTILYTADIVIVKRYFPASMAGAYAGVSSVANIVVFAAAPLLSVMLPHIKRTNTAEQNWLALRKGVLGVGVVGGIGVLGFALLPNFIVQLLMGARFLPYASLLPLQALAFFLVALANVLVMFGLALRKYALTVLAVCDSILLILLTVLHHGSPLEVVQNFLVTGLVILLGATFLTIRYASTLRRHSRP